jgi:hypothetical protein
VVDDELTAAVEEVEQARPAVGALEGVVGVERHVREPTALGGEGVEPAGGLLLPDEQCRAGGAPLLRGHERRQLRGGRQGA